MDPITIGQTLRTALKGHLSPISLDSVLQRHVPRQAVPVAHLAADDRDALAQKLELSLRLFSATPVGELRDVIRHALALDAEAPDQGRPTPPIDAVLVNVRGEVDVSVARSEARRIALEAGTSSAVAVKIATSVSELARNIVLYASTGSITLAVSRSNGIPTIEVVSRDDGPGIDSTILDALFNGRYKSKSGLGKGIVAVKRIADTFDLETSPGRGTTIRLTFRGIS